MSPAPAPAIRHLVRPWQRPITKHSTPLSGFGARRYMHSTMGGGAKIQPAKRVAGSRQDIWYVVDPLRHAF